LYFLTAIAASPVTSSYIGPYVFKHPISRPKCPVSGLASHSPPWANPHTTTAHSDRHVVSALARTSISTPSDSDAFEMVHTYGIAPESRVEPAHDDGEASALLGQNATVKRSAKDGHATLTSCVSNLSNTIIGSGMNIPSAQFDITS
jgi:hypothetical protein